MSFDSDPIHQPEVHELIVKALVLEIEIAFFSRKKYRCKSMLMRMSLNIIEIPEICVCLQIKCLMPLLLEFSHLEQDVVIGDGAWIDCG